MNERADVTARMFFRFAIAWGAMGLLAGVWLATELLAPNHNIAPAITFGRLRPLHTYLILYGFLGNAAFGGTVYACSRALATSPRFLTSVHLWVWQLAVAAGAACSAMGLGGGPSWSEAPWYVHCAFALGWLAYVVWVLDVVSRRTVRRLEPAVWFVLASLFAALLHHAIQLLVLRGALAGDNAVIVATAFRRVGLEFFFTTTVLGLLAFFIPRLTQREFASQRLLLTCFWALLVLFPLASPAGYTNSLAPEWLQSIGLLAKLLLLAPVLGIVYSFFVPLVRAWDRLRTEAALGFFVGSLLCFAALSVLQAGTASRGASALIGFTNWIVAERHLLGMGVLGLGFFGVVYALLPRLWGRAADVEKARVHRFLAILGVFLTVLPLLIAGAMEGSMWQAETVDGGLMYPGALETTAALRPFFWVRVAGGVLYFAGSLFLVASIWRTGHANDSDEALLLEQAPPGRLAGPVWAGCAVAALFALSVFVNAAAGVTMVLLALVGAAMLLLAAGSGRAIVSWHARLESRAPVFLLLIVLCSVGSSSVALLGLRPLVGADERPALAQIGHRVYAREGCHNCHSQMIRPYLWETARHGELVTRSSVIGPAFWGERRVGPDLSRVGGKYPSAWHFEHLLRPSEMTAGTVMPSYEHLLEEDFVAPPDVYEEARAVAQEIQAALGEAVPAESEMIALIVYLQSLRGGER